MFQKELLLIQIVHINSVGNVCYSKRIKKKKQHDILFKKNFRWCSKTNATCIYFFIKVYIARDIDKSILIFYFKSNVQLLEMPTVLYVIVMSTLLKRSLEGYNGDYPGETTLASERWCYHRNKHFPQSHKSIKLILIIYHSWL